MSGQGVAASMALAARRSGALLTLQVNLTTRCNLECRHCYRASERETDPVDLSAETIVDVLHQAADLGALWLTLTGGEPLLHPDLGSVLSCARKLRFAISVLTNGTLVDGSAADLLAESHPFRVQVSLYGATPEVHDGIVGVAGSYGSTVKGIRLLVERKVPVLVTSTVMAPNAEEIPALMELARNLGAQPQVAFLVTVGMHGDPRPAGLRASEAQIEALLRVSEIAEAMVRVPDPACPEEPLENSQNLCGAGVTALCVNADGTVWPCLTMPLEAGSVHEQSVAQIWRDSSVLEGLRKATFTDLAECRGCGLVHWCYRCPADALFEGGGLLGVSPEACRVARIVKRASEQVQAGEGGDWGKKK